jgi:hypothetical protein
MGKEVARYIDMEQILMIPPIIVNESQEKHLSGDVTFFQTSEAASQYLEPIDVANGEYFAFDSVGRLLKLQIAGQHVVIEDAERIPSHAGVLRDLLIEFFERAKNNQGPFEQLTLNQLINIGIESFIAK